MVTTWSRFLVHRDYFTKEEVSEDRKKFPHMIKKSPNGNNYFVDDDCAEFIFQIHGVPRILSHMYIADDLNWTAASGFIEEDDFIEVNNDLLSKYFDNKEVYNQLSTFYSMRLNQISNLNSVIPIYSHLNTFQRIGQSLDVALLDKKKDAFDQKYLTTYHDIIPYVFSKIESEGLFVDHDTFLNSFGLERRNLINDDRVLTNYNHYTTTGRPSNAYGGINYAALNKADDTRTSFVSRHENGKLVNMDFKSYHLFLIEEYIGIKLPEDPHRMLGQQYFKTTELTPEQYDESKVITFRNLYGYQFEDIVKDIPLFRNVDKFQDKLWSEYQSKGMLITEFGKKIVVENATRNKVFNYFVQSAEAETNIRYLYNLIKQDIVPILYTYDSMLFDVEEAKIDNLINIFFISLSVKISGLLQLVFIS